ncbi:MAG TPA: hypothetical protein VGB16_01525 [candidate division Zixibacteria bacterium]
MFIITYTYRVPFGRKDEFLEVQKQAKSLYARYGCSGYEVYEEKGSSGFCMEVIYFESEEHYQKVRQQVDADPQINTLWEKFCGIAHARENPPIVKKYNRIL